MARLHIWDTTAHSTSLQWYITFETWPCLKVWKAFALGRENVIVTSIRCRYMCVTASEITVHYSDVIMSAMTSEITGVSISCLAVCSGADQRKHPRSASLAFVRGNPPFDDVFMRLRQLTVLMNLQTINEWNLKALHSRSFVREIHGWAVDSPYKRPAIWKAFSMSWRHHGMEKLSISHDAYSYFLSVGIVLCHCTIYAYHGQMY